MPGARLRVQFLGLVSWPGTNRLHRSSGSAGASLGLGACAGDFAEPSSPPTILGHALPDGSLLDPADLACSELKVGSYLSGVADVVGPMELVEPSSPPTRSGNGKSQSKSESSVAASSAALEFDEESEEFLGDEVAPEDDFLRELEELKAAVYGVKDLPKKARRGQFAALKRLLERMEAFALTTAAAANVAEIQLSLM